MTEPEEQEPRSLLADLHDFAEVANAAAALLVGHRNILIEGGIDPAVVDQMIYNLHCKILQTHSYEYEDFSGETIFLIGEGEEDE